VRALARWSKPDCGLLLYLKADESEKADMGQKKFFPFPDERRANRGMQTISGGWWLK